MSENEEIEDEAPAINEHATVVESDEFDPENDANNLRKAMKGIGTDEESIIDIIAYRSNNQRQNIASEYKTLYGDDLITDLKSELSGLFKHAIIALMTPHYDFLAKQCHESMKGIGTDEMTLVDIIVPLYYGESINYLKDSYENLYKKSLELAITDECQGNVRRLLVSILQARRDESDDIDMDLVESDVNELYEADEGHWGTDESIFNKILVTRNYAHLNRLFDIYEQQYKPHPTTIESVIDKEMSGDTKMAFIALVKSIRNPCAYFAERLYQSMKGLGTDDKTLIRIIVTRSEVDLKAIKDEFKEKYGKTLHQFIADDSSGDYKRLLLALVRD